MCSIHTVKKAGKSRILFFFFLNKSPKEISNKTPQGSRGQMVSLLSHRGQPHSFPGSSGELGFHCKTFYFKKNQPPFVTTQL